MDLVTFTWRKLNCSGLAPAPRAAHASVVINTLQMLVYGGAAGSKSLQKY